MKREPQPVQDTPVHKFGVRTSDGVRAIVHARNWLAALGALAEAGLLAPIDGALATEACADGSRMVRCGGGDRWLKILALGPGCAHATRS